MAESTIPVDLLNPGHVFACLGIMEAADLLLGGAAGAFDWHDGRETMFRVAAEGSDPPVERVMRFLESAAVVTRVPAQSRNLDAWKTSWGTAPEVDRPGTPFPFPDPRSPATLPVVLRDDAGDEIACEYWGDTKRDNVKFWAGMSGKPGAAVMREAIGLARGKMYAHANNPFALAAAQTNSFRFDWRGNYIPIQDGFSPNTQNKHKKGAVAMVGFPVVEVLAAIGVTNARPHRKTKIEYRYGVLGLDRQLLDPMFHRAALGAETSPVSGRPFRRFVMRLDYPGREGDARSITQVSEEDTDQ